MKHKYCVTLESTDLKQVIDGLEIRAETWEQKALSFERDESANLIGQEKYNCVKEAKEISSHYRAIIEIIQSQIAEQQPDSLH